MGISVKSVVGSFDPLVAVSALRRAASDDFLSFSGRLDRNQFWHALGAIIALFLLAVLPGFIIPVLNGLQWVVALTSIPLIASLGVRRMHDISLSGAWFLVPVANLVFAARKGRAGPNRFGVDPDGFSMDTFA